MDAVLDRILAKRVGSWVVTDEFWQRVEPLIPARSVADKIYVRKPGAGRPPKPARLVFEAIVYVLRTGCQWKALPKERFGSASAVHKRFLEWDIVKGPAVTRIADRVLNPVLGKSLAVYATKPARDRVGAPA